MRGRAIRVMVVENHEAMRDGLIALLEGDEHIALVGTVAADSALDEYRRLVPEVTVVDATAAGSLELVQRIRGLNPSARIIPLVGYEQDEQLQAMMRMSGTTPLPMDQIGSRLLSLICDTD
jgi:DNA-binding NarL/FixJ family response regulator